MTVANEPASWNAAPASSLEFVNLGGVRPASTTPFPSSLESGAAQAVPISPQTRRTLVADWGQSLLGDADNGLKSKFDVSWPIVKGELLFSVGSMRSSFLHQRDEPGVLSEVSSSFHGDWWGPVWLCLTLSSLLVMAQSASVLLFHNEPGITVTTGSMWLAFVLPPLYVAYLGYALRLFCKIVVRDPTFFGTEQQREKCVSMAGYSLTPLVAFCVVDFLCGALGMRRTGTLHWLSLALTAFPSGHYLHRRFPITAIGGYADGWDRRSSRVLFWTAFASGFAVFVTTIQILLT